MARGTWLLKPGLAMKGWDMGSYGILLWGTNFSYSIGPTGEILVDKIAYGKLPVLVGSYLIV
jgi:hypothetical protein